MASKRNAPFFRRRRKYVNLIQRIIRLRAVSQETVESRNRIASVPYNAFDLYVD